MPPPAVRVKRERLVWAKSLSSETRDRPINLETPSPSPKKKARGSDDLSNDIPYPDFGSEADQARGSNDISNDIPNPYFGCEAEQDSIEEELERLVKEQEEEEDAMDVASPSS